MRHFLLCALLLPAVATAEIYRWTDANGQVHFGAAPQAGAVQVEVKPPVAQHDAVVAERQQRTERFFDARRQEQQQASEQAREQQAKTAQECQQLREQFAVLDRGGRYYRVDAQGEMQYYDEKQIDSARSQLKARLAQRCN
ncbi:MAG: DUF4124 domain-containing protein [Pseudomonas sp.]|uniref:DUF4124 domain-containing protein n=1 Tax=Pseudomonas sp. TaxID=306 RepID=UPI002737019B|nr:DUF4124 domain-containing protein [Pseudomonas sp.]MDP3848843.1 DUF4124 domain-containing protein [Pseudomonas sp.]